MIIDNREENSRNCPVVMLSDGELEHLLAHAEGQIRTNQADLDSYECYVTGQIEWQRRATGSAYKEFIMDTPASSCSEGSRIFC